MADSSGRPARSWVDTRDLDLAAVRTAADLGQLLDIVRTRADMKYRDLEAASKHTFLLSKAKIGDALSGKNAFVRKEFLATFLELCDVPPEQRKDWLVTWERLAPTCSASGRKARVVQVTDEADQLERDARTRADTILRQAQQRADRVEEDMRTRADTVLHSARERAEQLDQDAQDKVTIVLRDANARAEALAKTVAVDRVAAVAKAILQRTRQRAAEYRSRHVEVTQEHIDKMLVLAKCEAQQIRADAHHAAQEIETRVRAWAESHVQEVRDQTDSMIKATQAELAGREAFVEMVANYAHMQAEAIADLAYAHRRRYRPWKWRMFNRLAETTATEILIDVMHKLAADPSSPLAPIAQHGLKEIGQSPSERLHSEAAKRRSLVMRSMTGRAVDHAIRNGL